MVGQAHRRDSGQVREARIDHSGMQVMTQGKKMAKRILIFGGHCIIVSCYGESGPHKRYTIGHE